jgi:hypothetical protein
LAGSESSGSQATIRLLRDGHKPETGHASGSATRDACLQLLVAQTREPLQTHGNLRGPRVSPEREIRAEYGELSIPDR